MSETYIFQSQRLGFRNWSPTDFDQMAAINGNKNVMRYFPAVATNDQTTLFIKRMQALYDQKKYCYFAVDLIETGEFIGFIGLNDLSYEASFSPAVDIGWRLGEQYWGNGYATEGAKQCLSYAFKTLGLDTIVCTAPQINKPSIAVMKKLA